MSRSGRNKSDYVYGMLKSLMDLIHEITKVSEAKNARVIY